jgi:hypothetical protein
VRDASGREVGVWRQQCNAFATTITLYPGEYTAVARLVDGAGNPRTTDVQVTQFSIHGNDVMDVPVDFPGSSFK